MNMRNMFFSIVITSSRERKMGRLYSPFLKNPVMFNSLLELNLLIEQIMDDCDVPKCDNSYERIGCEEKEIYRKLEYTNSQIVQLKNYSNQMKLFTNLENVYFVEMIRRQNCSWQGIVTWLNENKTEFFKSELELMKLICN